MNLKYFEKLVLNYSNVTRSVTAYSNSLYWNGVFVLVEFARAAIQRRYCLTVFTGQIHTRPNIRSKFNSLRVIKVKKMKCDFCVRSIFRNKIFRDYNSVCWKKFFVWTLARKRFEKSENLYSVFKFFLNTILYNFYNAIKCF